jgi:murein DD-endopeptidase MepM/ murein hydrolase activator NlpD
VTTPSDYSGQRRGAPRADDPSARRAGSSTRIMGVQALDQSLNKVIGEFNKLADTVNKLGSRLQTHTNPTTGLTSANQAGITQQSGAPVGVGGGWRNSATSWLATKMQGFGPPGTPGMGYAALGGNYMPPPTPNGGGSTFGGAPAAGSAGPGAHLPENQGGARTPSWYTVPGQSKYGQTLNPRTWSTGQRATYGSIAALTAYSKAHEGDRTLMQSVAAEYAYSGDEGPIWDSMFRGTYGAQSTTDAAAANSTIAATAGYMPGSSQYSRLQGGAGAQAASIANPAISMAQGATAQAALGTMASTNLLRGLGINTYTKNGAQAGLYSVARQILARIDPNKSINTKEQVQAMLGLNGPIEVTLNNMVANGFIPAESRESLRSIMKEILTAQTHGVGAAELRQLNQAAAQGDGSANQSLQDMGIRNSLVARDQAKQGAQRDTDLETMGGFVSATKQATTALTGLRKALNHILGFAHIGDALGYGGGWLSSGFGSLLNMTPAGSALNMGSSVLSKIGGLFGGSAPTMSQSMTGGRTGGFAVRGVGGVAPTMSRGSSASHAGSGDGGGGGGQSSGGNAHAGVSFIAPRPGVDNLGPEGDFGPRTIGQGWHTGIDLDGPAGATIIASAAGTVINAGWGGRPDRDGGYGNCVTIDHGGGYLTLYCHMQSISVHKGSQVRQGQGIGTVGNTGSYSQGAHLHFELWVSGTPVNPVPYLHGRHANIKPGQAGSGSSSGGQSGTGQSLGDGVAFGSGHAVSGIGNFSEAAALAGGSGAGSSSTGTGSSSGSGNSGSSGGSVSTGGFGGISGGGSSTQNIALGKQMAARYGWGSGSEWKSLLTLWNHESGWRTTADNPSSSAYGIPQALTDLHDMPPGYGDGDHPGSGDPKVQIAWGLNYIKGRYGDPNKAWDFWQAHNWYDKGAWSLSKDETAKVHRGEMILPAQFAEAVRNQLQVPGWGGKTGGSGQVSIVFEEGSIKVGFSGPVSDSHARNAGKQIVDAMMDDTRMRALAAGDR